MSFRKGFILGLAMLLAVAAGVLGSRVLRNKSTETIQESQSPAVYSSQSPLIGNLEALAAHVEGAVVNITSDHDNAISLFDPLSDLLGGHGFLNLLDGSRNSGRNNLGSGFIVSRDGYILTNSHVIENASRISVKLKNHGITEAVMVGTDPKTDLAVLKIKSADLPALRLAPSADVQVGEWVASFGDPFGEGPTMTAGIISAKGRVVGSEYFDSLFQTDAEINPGTSGGPLLNLQGEVVGVNTVIPNLGRGFSGIGFAIPADTAQRVYQQLLKSGKVTRGWIGIRIQEVTPEIAKSFDLKNRKGALVSEVAPGGPAAKAGLKPGDIIVEFNREQIWTSQDLSAAVADTKVGTSAGIKIIRSGKALTEEVTVGERPAAVARHFRTPQRSEPGRLGLLVEDVTPEIQAEMHLSSSRGVLVLDVTPGSSAENGGVRPGDVIHAINRSPISTAADLLAVARNLEQHSIVLLRVERQGQVFYLAFEML